MSKYDFTSIIDRHGRDALAVDMIGDAWAPGAPAEGVDAIPMWVADMNFRTVPTITEAIAERIKHPLFGYFIPTDEYYDSIIKWQTNRNGVTGLSKEHIGYENGVVGGVVSALNAVCSRGDNVLLHSPTYIGFTEALTNNGYNMVLSPLVIEDGVWRMDYEDMERRIVENNIHAAVFCSPHNPTGRVWEREELERAMELFRKHDVYVVSDEIWSDIILSGNRHIPTQSVSEDARKRTVALYAPSKTFNLAGLIGSYHIIYDKWLRDRVNKESSLCTYNNMNVLSMHALIGAYKPEGYEWCDELREVITTNVELMSDLLTHELQGFTLCKPQGTYMLFTDCSGYLTAHGMTLDELLRRLWDAGVSVQDGRGFHGETHIRMNLASPTSRIREAMDRMKRIL